MRTDIMLFTLEVRVCYMYNEVSTANCVFSALTHRFYAQHKRPGISEHNLVVTYMSNIIAYVVNKEYENIVNLLECWFVLSRLALYIIHFSFFV